MGMIGPMKPGTGGMPSLPARATWLSRFRALRLLPCEGKPAAGDVAEPVPIRWLLMLILVYAAPVIAVMRPVTDPDIWWHLRMGEWIARQRAVPWTDPFSSYGLGRPWIAYNWLFELLLYGLYRTFNLYGPLVYSTIVSLAVAMALHAFVMHFEHRFARAAALTALGVGAMGPVLMPRSFLTTILFFIIELHVLFSVRESGRTRPLLVLPPLFALWANLHIQFIYGLLALALAAGETLLYRFSRRNGAGPSPHAVPFRPLLLVGLASCAATLLTPYHVYLHRSILEVVRQVGVFDWVLELVAMDFRQPANWLVLGLALGAAFVLGRQQNLPPFPALLFVAGVLLSFRARRDVWVVVVASLAVIASSSGERVGRKAKLTWSRILVVGAGVALVLVALAIARNVTPRGLEVAVAKDYPAEAAAIVEARGYEGPLFNPYDWGGYLIWRLPGLPVSMDGRANLHGDDRISRSIDTWRGRRLWASDPELAAAKLVITPVNIALTSLLRMDSRFELVHEDEVAAVFVNRVAGTER